MAYPTVEELVGASDVPELTGASAADQSAFRDAAIRAVESECGQPFGSVAETRSLDGKGGATLYLPQRLDTLVGIDMVGAAWTLSDVVLADGHDRLTIRSYGSGYYERAMRDVQGVGDVSPRFPLGYDIITITGVWGWAVCPEPVVQALRIDMEDTARADANDLAPSVAVMHKLGLNALSQGNLRLNLTDVPGQLAPRALRLLGDDLHWHGGTGELA